MKRLLTVPILILVLALCAVPLPQAAAQSAINSPHDLGFAYANDYNKWSFKSNNTGTLSAGSVIITIANDYTANTPDGRPFIPFSTTAPVLIDAASSNNETLTPSAVTCSSGQLQGTCTFTVTTSNSHTGNFTIQSGTYGICEAANNLLNTYSGGTVVVANGFGGSTSTITSSSLAGACKSASVNILDTRSGSFNFYASNGTSYVLSTAPITGSVAPAATVTAVVGTPASFLSQTQSTNWAIADAGLGANTSGGKLALMKTRSTNADGRATTTIVTADDLGLIDAFGADGTNYIESAAIEFQSTGTIAATRVPSKIILKTSTDAAPSVLTAALTLDKDQSATFAGNVYIPTVRNSATAPDSTVTSVATAPDSIIVATGSTNAQEVTAQIGANTAGAQTVFLKTRAATNAAAATTTVVTGDTVSQMRYFGADGTNYVEGARIEANTTGTIASTRVPMNLKFYTGTDAAPTVVTQALLLDKDQSATFAGNVTALGLVASTGNSAAAGFATTFADTGSPAAGSTGTNTTGIAHQLWYTQIFVPYNMTATNVAVLCGGTCTTDKIAIGLWTTAGTLLKATAATDAGGTTLSGANTWQKIALTSTQALSGPARYIIGVVTSGTTAGDIQTYPLASGPVCAVASAQGTLASFSPATTATASSCPYAFID